MIAIVSAWCPTCRVDAVPQSDGTCGFCDTPTDMQEQSRQRDSVARAALCTSLLAVTAGITREISP